jgi:hypothetical protein
MMSRVAGSNKAIKILIRALKKEIEEKGK